MLKRHCLSILSLFLILGCTNLCETTRGELTPEQVVENYLEIALNMTDVSEKDHLIEYTTGSLLEAIKSAPVEVIKSAYVDKSYRLESYAVVERIDRTPRESEITFRLKYYDPNGVAENEDAPLVTTENTVSTEKIKGMWFISDVLGQKTSIDFPVAAGSRITAEPPKKSN